MTNCYFKDLDLKCSVKTSSIEKDYYGYFIKIYLPKSKVSKFFTKDIVPAHELANKWYFPAMLNNATKILIDGKKSELFEAAFLDLTSEDIKVYNLNVSFYSKKTKMNKPGRLTSISIRHI